MSFIHYEWCSAPAEAGETLRLWAWRRRALIIDSLPLFFTHKVPFRPERTREEREWGKKKRLSPSRGKRTSGGFTHKPRRNSTVWWRTGWKRWGEKKTTDHVMLKRKQKSRGVGMVPSKVPVVVLLKPHEWYHPVARAWCVCSLLCLWGGCNSRLVCAFA